MLSRKGIRVKARPLYRRLDSKCVGGRRRVALRVEISHVGIDVLSQPAVRVSASYISSYGVKNSKYYGRTDGRTDELTDNWMDRLRDGRIDGWADGRRGGWMAWRDG